LLQAHRQLMHSTTPEGLLTNLQDQL